ncbi:MAG: helix-turn-helix domain-containing protein [Desulfobaccales bacterium]
MRPVHKSKASKKLGTSRTTLWRKLKGREDSPQGPSQVSGVEKETFRAQQLWAQFCDCSIAFRTSAAYRYTAWTNLP